MNAKWPEETTDCEELPTLQKNYRYHFLKDKTKCLPDLTHGTSTVPSASNWELFWYLPTHLSKKE